MFIRRKRRKQIANVSHLERGNDVDILSEARLSIGNTGDRTDDQVRRVHAFQRFNGVTQDIDLLHAPGFSSSIRDGAARRSSQGEVA
jgi:hypothetical protein